MKTYIEITTIVLVITLTVIAIQYASRKYKEELEQIDEFEITKEDMINRDRVQEKHMVYSAKSGTENEKM